MLFSAVGYAANWFEVLQTNFMRNALIGGTIVALAAGVIGYFVVIRRDAFGAHALAHIGFPGATGAVLIGVPISLGLLAFCVAGGLAIGVLGKRVERREIATGTILAFAMSLGVLFGSLATRSSATITNVLFGNLLAITVDELVTFTGFCVIVLVVLAVVARPLLFASISPEVAEARGVRVRMLGVTFMVLLAIVVTMAVQVVGTLLLFALVVTPAATALTITARPVLVVTTSTAISLLAVWVGLVLSAMFNLPPSFPIVGLAFVGWLVSLAAVRGRPAGSGPDGVVADHHHHDHDAADHRPATS